MNSLRNRRDEIVSVLHRAIDMDQVAILQIEALRDRSHSPELTDALDSIMDRVMANAQALRQLYGTTPSSSFSSPDLPIERLAQKAIIAAARKNRIDR